jgi:hypothetical protein
MIGVFFDARIAAPSVQLSALLLEAISAPENLGWASRSTHVARIGRVDPRHRGCRTNHSKRCERVRR